jgi:hypothetical protein
MEQFLPSEFKILLARRESVFETETEKSDLLIRRLSAENENFEEQIENLLMDSSIMKEELENLAGSNRKIKKLENEKELLKSKIKNEIEKNKILDELKKDNIDMTETIRTLKENIKSTKCNSDENSDSYPVDRIQRDLNHQLKMIQTITDDFGNEIAELERKHANLISFKDLEIKNLNEVIEEKKKQVIINILQHFNCWIYEKII